jgi:hypothetical protein
MTRSIAFLSVSFSLWLAVAGVAYGQAAVEAGLGAARAATTTAPAKGLGKSMSGLAGSLDKALKAGAFQGRIHCRQYSFRQCSFRRASACAGSELGGSRWDRART